MMPTHLAFWVCEAAVRSLMMALAVWAGIRLLRVRAIQAQKIAWALVLLAAASMPIAMRIPWLKLERLGLHPLQIPLRPALAARREAEPSGKPTVTAGIMEPQPSAAPLLATRAGNSPGKPHAAHRYEAAPATPAFLPQNAAFSSVQVVGAISAPDPGVPTSVRPKRDWTWSKLRSAALGIYYAIALLLVLRIGLGLAIALRIWLHSRPVQIGSLSAGIAVRVSCDLTAPVTIGSTIILPTDYTDWDAVKLRIVLAHEQAHIHQRDFHLQFLAALHAAAFWFSPLGWWLQRKLSELGEALSDRAGLEQSPTPAAYAQILLEFAARPRTSMFSGLVAGPLTGVAMARTSNLSTRIERILASRRFCFTELASRRHAVLAGALVPLVLVVVVGSIRIVPAVEAARQTQAPAPTNQPATGQVAPNAPDQVTSVDDPQAATPAPMPSPIPNPDSLPGPGTSQAPAVPALPPIPPIPSVDKRAPKGEIAGPAAPALPAVPAIPALPPMPPMPNKSFVYRYSADEDGANSFAIVRADGNITGSFLHYPNKSLEEAKRKYGSNFIWFERDGKSYAITDPAVLAQAKELSRSNEEANRGLRMRQVELDRMQAKLNAEMASLQPEIERASQPGPEFAAEMAKLQKQIGEMHLDKLTSETALGFSPEQQADFQRKMAALSADIAKSTLSTPQFQTKMGLLQQQIGILQRDASNALSLELAKGLSENKDLMDKSSSDLAGKKLEAERENGILKAEKLQELVEKRLEELQEKIGDLQGRVGEMQGEIGERIGRIGEKQGEIGERIGQLGEEMGRIGEQQGKLGEEMSRKVQSLIDQAVKNGKAFPVD